MPKEMTIIGNYYNKYNTKNPIERFLLKNYEDKHISRTFGADLMVNFTRGLAVMMSYDRLNGYGITSNAIFAELRVRF